MIETFPDPVSAPPRPSATVLILRDDPFEVLMVRRSTRAGDAFSSALVFPGGVVEPQDRDPAWIDRVEGGERMTDDERALRIAACRETFEEVAILLGEARGSRPTAAGRDFRTMLRSMAHPLSLGKLVPFAHWITPAGMSRRYDTHFFLARLPEGAEPRCDGVETVALEWASPRDLAARAEAGLDGIVFPTRLNLLRLAESASVDEAFAAAQARAPFTVTPWSERRNGRHVVVIPLEAGYGITEDWRPD